MATAKKKEVMTEEQLLEKCLKATKGFAFFNDFEDDSEKPKVELTPEQKKINELVSIIQRGFGCERGNVKNLVEAIMDIKLPAIATESSIKEESPTFKRYACIVMTVQMKGHDYPIGEVTMLTGNGSSGHYKNRSIGNSLTGCRNGMRPATEEEIKSFVKENYAFLVEHSLI